MNIEDWLEGKMLADAWGFIDGNQKAYPYLVKSSKTGELGFNVNFDGDTSKIKSVSCQEFQKLLSSGSYPERTTVRLTTKATGGQKNGYPIRKLHLSERLKKALGKIKVDAALGGSTSSNSRKKTSVESGTRDSYDDYQEVNDETMRDAIAIMSLSDDEIEEALKELPNVPEKREITVTTFKRNPYVVASVLKRASGNCEGCKSYAPFYRKSNGTPYLEVHHVEPLANGGLDTVENAEALCPNCHRERHYGK